MLNHGPTISSFRKYIFHAEVNVASMEIFFSEITVPDMQLKIFFTMKVDLPEEVKIFITSVNGSDFY